MLLPGNAVNGIDWTRGQRLHRLGRSQQLTEVITHPDLHRPTTTLS
jgi:hypothetical protein